VSDKAVITAIKPPSFVFDIDARGALMPGVGVGVSEDIFDDGDGDVKILRTKISEDIDTRVADDYLQDRQRIGGV
jgi:hypothetical protein